MWGRFLLCTACVEVIRRPTWIRVHLSASPVITASSLAQCSTATTCTIQTRLCSMPLWTEDLWRAFWHMNPPLFLLAHERLEPGTISVRGRRSTNWAIPTYIIHVVLLIRVWWTDCRMWRNNCVTKWLATYMTYTTYSVTFLFMTSVILFFCLLFFRFLYWRSTPSVMSVAMVLVVHVYVLG